MLSGLGVWEWCRVGLVVRFGGVLGVGGGGAGGIVGGNACWVFVLVLLERLKGGSEVEGSSGCFVPKMIRDGFESEVLSDVSASSKAGGVGFGD